jgi:hypothetical protein
MPVLITESLIKFIKTYYRSEILVDISVVEMEMVNLNAPKHLPSVLSVKTFRSTFGQNKNEKLTFPDKCQSHCVSKNISEK